MRHLRFLISIVLLSTPLLAQSSSTPEFRSGYSRGQIAGKDFAQEPGSEPNFDYLSHLTGIMEQASASNREAWRQGWVKGAQDGFRGIKPSSRDAARYLSLSPQVAKAGVKLYGLDEVHQATVVSADVSKDTMVIRYRKSGTTEPKSISALSPLLFVRKNDAALKAR